MYLCQVASLCLSTTIIGVWHWDKMGRRSWQHLQLGVRVCTITWLLPSHLGSVCGLYNDYNSQFLTKPHNNVTLSTTHSCILVQGYAVTFFFSDTGVELASPSTHFLMILDTLYLRATYFFRNGLQPATFFIHAKLTFSHRHITMWINLL